MTDAKYAPASKDVELIALVRAGDTAAYEELFVRHRDVALRYARRLADPERAEDLCSEAFAKIFDLLRRGKGPNVSFRAYLLTTIRTSHLNTIRSGRHEELVPDHEPSSRTSRVVDDPDARFDRDAICRAFTQLPQRWQAALWLTTVEGLSNKEAGEHLGIKVNAVASLSFRARAGLREAYLAEHLLDTTDPQCRRVLEMVPGHLRNTLGAGRQGRVNDHLAACAACTAAYLELSYIDTSLKAALAPLAAAGFSATSLTTSELSLGHLVEVVRSWGSGVATAAAVSVATVGLAVGAWALDRPEQPAAAQVAPATVLETNRGTGQLRIPRAAPDPQARVQPAPPAPQPTSPSPTQPSAAQPPAVTPPPAKPVIVPTTTPTPTPGPTTGPTVVPTTGPSTTPPTTTPPTTTPPTPTAREMAVGAMQASAFERSASTWRRASIPVTNPEEGALLQLTATRTRNARLVPSTSGWTCARPRLSWSGGADKGTSTTDCAYDGRGDGSALQVEFLVEPGSRLTARLTPPAGYLDTTLLDNLGVLDLLG